MAYRNPTPTVDVIIRTPAGVVLIERANPPHGWALPGGFVDEGERVEEAAVREAREETRLDVTLQELLYVYSDPARDPRQHTMSVVFTATASARPEAADDARDVAVVPLDSIRAAVAADPPAWSGGPFCFDHAQILRDYIAFVDSGARPKPVHRDGCLPVPTQP